METTQKVKKLVNNLTAKTSSLLLIILAFGVAACRNANEELRKSPSTETTPKTIITPENKPTLKVSYVDVPTLADKSAQEFDELFGTPLKISPVRNNPKLMPGEYRRYAVADHPKGLSVRFYKNKAKRFNLLLGKKESSAEDALRQIFRIDVSKLKKVTGDPLSETWKGKSGGIEFKTAYAKRDKSSGKFVMLHAEVEK